MIGGGGDSNSEYGISINDINNSSKRLSKTEGYVSQGKSMNFPLIRYCLAM